jgi:hypothetical protein
MANQTLSDAYRYISSENLLFTRNKDRWTFLWESYMGGEVYRRAGNLVRYALESDAEYTARLYSTPLDNHCQSVISVYTSFLFREPPFRELTGVESPLTDDFLRDADLDGRSFDNFMKDVSTWASVFGHCWVLMTKPNIEAQTEADQRAAGIRPYVSLLTPLVVLDWDYIRQPNGRYDVSYFKYIEDVNDQITIVREWTPTTITTYEQDNEKLEAKIILEEENPLGIIPVIPVYNKKSQIRGIGIGDIDDIADQQRAIYNEMSEVEQSIRLEGHPSLVKTPDTETGSGAGAIIHMPENLDPGLKPYILKADATPIDMIYKSIENRIAAIDKMANTGGIRATETREMSGIALETEFQLLNARLGEKANQLALAEEQIWNLWAIYQNRFWMGNIQYPGSFNIRDNNREIERLRTAKEVATDPEVFEIIDRNLVILLGYDPDEVLVDTLEFEDDGIRRYEDGGEIDPNLPDAYQSAQNEEVPDGQMCSNCVFYDKLKGYCNFWQAQARPQFWCAAWSDSE